LAWPFINNITDIIPNGFKERKMMFMSEKVESRRQEREPASLFEMR